MSERESKTRSRALRSYVFATFKTRSTTELVEFLPVLVARMIYEKTPRKTIQEVVQQFLDYLEIKGVAITPELVELRDNPRPGVGCTIPELDKPSEFSSFLGKPDTSEALPEIEDDGIVDLESREETKSPMLGILQNLMQKCWDRSKEDKFPKFLWKEFIFEGERYYAVATWRLRSGNAEWNVAASSSDGLVHRSPLLARHEGRVLNVTQDFNDLLVAFPASMKSAFAGTHVYTTGTLFIWALKWKQGAEIRCWLNESVGGKRSAAGDLVRCSRVMPHFPAN